MTSATVIASISSRFNLFYLFAKPVMDGFSLA